MELEYVLRRFMITWVIIYIVQWEWRQCGDYQIVDIYYLDEDILQNIWYDEYKNISWAKEYIFIGLFLGCLIVRILLFCTLMHFELIQTNVMCPSYQSMRNLSAQQQTKKLVLCISFFNLVGLSVCESRMPRMWFRATGIVFEPTPQLSSFVNAIQ